MSDDAESKANATARAIADYLAKEDQWIIQRTGWNLTGQGFLIAALASLDKAKNPELTLLLYHALPFLGGAIALLTLLSLFGAISRQAKLIDEWIGNPDLRSHVAPYGVDYTHEVGLIAPVAIPVVLLVFWSYIGCQT